MTDRSSLPVAIIGAGPVGLAAAAHVRARGLTPLVLEAGSRIGDAVRRWGHVRLFSPWKFVVDGQSRRLLERRGWTPPAPESFPTGSDLVGRYLEPLASTPEIAPHVRLGARVVAVAKQGRDRMKDGGRDEAPFIVRVRSDRGDEDILARAVIDASGTIDTPGPAGASGVPALGERQLADRVFYGIPDVLGMLRARYADRRVLVVGSGHSAFNVLIDLAQLVDLAPRTQIAWAIRRPALGAWIGGGADDQLPERGRLGLRVRDLIESGRIALSTGVQLDRFVQTSDGIVGMAGDRAIPPVDELIVATGFRPDWSILSEIRLDLDPSLEAPRALAPLIDPNVHSCGTVPPHGATELQQPDRDIFVVGMKSYGRAPTFLLLTGYEQVRSVVSAIAGDWDAARRVELVLPETGVCSVDSGVGDGSCCTSPAAPTPAAVPLSFIRR